jgi:hypothetical protein
MLAGKERLQAPLAQPARVGRARVALQERERDLAVEILEQADRPGPEARELCAQLVAQRDLGVHEILARAGQRSERLGLVAVGLEHPEAMAVGARELADHERVEPVGLAARDPEPGAGRGDLVGVQRQHPQPRVQQPLDQQPVRALDRDQLHLQPHERATQRPQARFIVRERGGQQLLARLVGDQHVVLLRRPVNTGVTSHLYSSSVRSPSQRPDQEVPLRNLIDRPSTGATSCCRSRHLTTAERGWSAFGLQPGKK